MYKLPVFVSRQTQRFSRLSRKQRALIIGGVIALVAIVIPVGTYAYYANDITDPERLMNHNNTGVALLDKNGEVFYSRGEVKNLKRVSLADISDYAEKALVASEDKNFYTDPGFSVSGMARAMFNNVKESDLTGSGGSGITQQLVKNNLLTSEKSYLRKYQELSMAVAIERHYSKDQILELYLNSVYFGNDSFGIEMAAQTYFGKSAKDLDLAESAMLIGILPAPSAYSPTTGDKDMAEKRQAYVLQRMQEDSVITDTERQSAEVKELVYKAPENGDDGYAHHFALMVIDELNNKYGEERVARSGFRVKTTLDLDWQKQAEKAVADQVSNLSKQDARNGALVAIDPKSGEIRALVGSADWNNPEYGKVNMATTPRQPGSSFKPIYYTQALDKRVVTAATILEDEPTDFGGGYKPTNYDFKYRGDVTLRYALANSLNIPAVKVMEKIGVEESVRTAQRMGIASINDADTYGLSLALGTAEARLLDMTNAYAALAHNGEQYDATSVSEIKDKFSNTVYKYSPKAERVMGEEASYIMSSILSDEKARYPLAGTKFNIGRPAAVKTGTTNDEKDAWTIGYTPQITIGVWVGNNDNTPMRGVGGSLGAGPIWRSAMTSFLKDTPAEAFTSPKNIVRVTVCNPNRYQEVFIKGTESEFICKQQDKQKGEEKKKPEESERKPEKPEKPSVGNDPKPEPETTTPDNQTQPTDQSDPTTPPADGTTQDPATDTTTTDPTTP